tara:strand:+ start:7699 stop:8571 length:873 start_codon:yes stop_codon:yes gene_type:complete
MNSSSSYHLPCDLTSALNLLSEHSDSAKIVAGGQSIMLLLRQGFLSSDIFIDISDISELSEISIQGGAIHVGAATTYTSLENSLEIQPYSVLLDSLHVIADPQIRNLGTIGGALGHADPSLDIVPPLLCLDANVVVQSLNATRAIPLSDFHQEYMTADLSKDELIHSITFNQPTGIHGGAYEKVANVEGGWPTVGVAAQVKLGENIDSFLDVKIALAAVGDTAIRSYSVEKSLIGSEISMDSIRESSKLVCNDIDPLDDLSGSAGYKTHLAGVLCQRALVKAINRAGGSL